MTSIDKVMLESVREDTNKFLKAMSGKYGVKFDMGNSSYNAVKAKFSITVVKLGDYGSEFGEEERDFRNNAPFYGLEPSDLRRIFESRGYQYILIGSKSSNHKYPILGQRVGTDRLWKFTPAGVKDKFV